jgi:putative oxidoreductase
MNLAKLLTARGPDASILIRAMVGAVFLSEGLQKFVFPAELGVGRFAKIGFASPDLLAPFVACFEIGCGSLVMLGLVTRIAALPLIAIMVTAIVSTKLPILVGRDIGPFQLAPLPRTGFWAMAHEARADWSMLLGSLFLLIAGGGRWSLDAWLEDRRSRRDSP